MNILYLKLKKKNTKDKSCEEDIKALWSTWTINNSKVNLGDHKSA